MSRFARSLGSRPSDPEYASALYGPQPRSGRIRGFLCWLAGLGLPFLVYMVCK